MKRQLDSKTKLGGIICGYSLKMVLSTGIYAAFIYCFLYFYEIEADVGSRFVRYAGCITPLHNRCIY